MDCTRFLAEISWGQNWKASTFYSNSFFQVHQGSGRECSFQVLNFQVTGPATFQDKGKPTIEAIRQIAQQIHKIASDF